MAESPELLTSSGVVEQVHRYHEVDLLLRLERRNVRLYVFATEWMASFFVFGESSHRRRDVDARDLRRASLLEQAPIKPVPAGQVEDLSPSHVA